MGRVVGRFGPLLLLLVAGCATNASGPPFDQIAQGMLAAGYARVYVFREKVFYVVQALHIVRADVAIDGRPIGGLTNGGFLTADVPAGRHVVSVASRGVIADQSVKYFDVASGNRVYVEVYDKSRMEGARAASGAVGGAVGGAVMGASQASAEGEATRADIKLGAAGGAVNGAIAGAAYGFAPPAPEGEGRIWAVDFAPEADALYILKGLALSQ
jgi:Protein of unknown function (DUF2846)